MELTEGQHQEWSLWLNLTHYGKLTRSRLVLDSMGGGAWPFLVCGVICLVRSVSERDLSLLNSVKYDSYLITS